MSNPYTREEIEEFRHDVALLNQEPFLISKINAMLCRWLATVDARDAEIARLTSALTEKGRLIAAMEDTLAERITPKEFAEALAKKDTEIARLNVHLSNVSGALVDTSTVKVGDEESYAEGVRALIAERDRLRDHAKDVKLQAMGYQADLARFRGLLREAQDAFLDILESANAEQVLRFDDGDIELATYCQKVIAKLTHELAEPTKAQEVGK